MLDPHLDQLGRAREAAGRALVAVLSRADATTRELAASLRALSPQGTLDRGYAIVRDAHGAVVRSASAVAKKDAVGIRVAEGELDAVVTAARPPQR
jgi:exodeoxyribonuclease VII large subunit